MGRLKGEGQGLNSPLVSSMAQLPGAWHKAPSLCSCYVLPVCCPCKGAVKGWPSPATGTNIGRVPISTVQRGMCRSRGSICDSPGCPSRPWPPGDCLGAPAPLDVPEMPACKQLPPALLGWSMIPADRGDCTGGSTVCVCVFFGLCGATERCVAGGLSAQALELYDNPHWVTHRGKAWNCMLCAWAGGFYVACMYCSGAPLAMGKIWGTEM